jgi:hypothetical protein
MVSQAMLSLKTTVKQRLSSRRPYEERFTAITRLPRHLTTLQTTSAVTYTESHSKSKEGKDHYKIW